MSEEELVRLEMRCQAAIASENNGKRFIPATEEEIRFLVYELSNIPVLIAEVRRQREYIALLERAVGTAIQEMRNA